MSYTQPQIIQSLRMCQGGGLPFHLHATFYIKLQTGENCQQRKVNGILTAEHDVIYGIIGL